MESLLSILKEKSNGLNHEFQEFQSGIKKLLEADMNTNDKSMLKRKINALCDNYCVSVNKLEVECFIKCEQFMQNKNDNGCMKEEEYTPPSIDDDNDEHAMIDIDESTKQQLEEEQATNPWRCSLCDSDFTAKQYLNLHIAIVHHQSPWKCGECDASFRVKSDLNKHRKSIHKNRKNVDTDSSSKYQCGVCFKSFKDGRALGGHKAITGHVRSDGFQCDLCRKPFATKQKLQKHRSMHVSSSSVPSLEPLGTKKTETVSTQNKPKYARTKSLFNPRL